MQKNVVLARHAVNSLRYAQSWPFN